MLTGVKEVILPANAEDALDLSKELEKSQKSLSRSGLSIVYLAVPFTTEDLTGKVHETCATAHPGGLAHLRVQYLMETCHSND